MAIEITTQPVVEPISLTEMKLHLRVDHTDDDELITALISAARVYCEKFQNTAYVVRTYRLSMDRFPSNDIQLPYPPAVSVSSVVYTDEDEASQTLAASYYSLDARSIPARFGLAYNESWPTTLTVNNAVSVNYIAGSLTSFTAAEATDIITVSGRVFADSDVVRLSNTGGALPAGLSTLTDYYVRDYTGSTLKLALTDDGVAVNFTDDGTGTNFIGVFDPRVAVAMKMLTAHWYENREASTCGVTITTVPMGVSPLLWQDRA